MRYSKRSKGRMPRRRMQGPRRGYAEIRDVEIREAKDGSKAIWVKILWTRRGRVTLGGVEEG